LEEVTVASSEYLNEFGIPSNINELTNTKS